MRLHEIINKKERVDEIFPAIGAAAVAAAPYIANLARIVGPHVYKWVARHGLKKVASQFGHKLPAVFRKWGPKTPADSSVPDALAKAKVGYGTGQVDPSLATAAKKKYTDPSTQLPKQVAKPAPPQRIRQIPSQPDKLSPEAGAAIAQAQQAQKKRQRP